MNFLPNISTLLNENIFILAASLLFAGFIFAQLIKPLRFPRVTGYIIAGIILGPSLLKLFHENSLLQLNFIPDLTLGIIALIIGAGLSFSLIKRLGPPVILITILQALGAFILVFIFLYLLKMPLEAALPLAAIATATDPAATLAVIKEFKARGPLTETVMAVVALDDAVAIVIFGLVLTIDVKHLSTFGQTAIHSLSESFIEILAALLVGILLGILAHVLIKLTKELSDSLIILLGTVLLAVGIATVTHISPLLTNMFIGLTIINISEKNESILENMNKITPPIYCFFFVLSGAYLNLKVFAMAGLLMIAWGSAFVLMRIAGKIGGAYLGGTATNVSESIRKYLGLTLVPQAGIAVGLPLMITASSSYFEFRPLIINITLVAVAFNIIFGPILTKYALFKAKEATHEE
ncbi:MAG: cation:proton antiporter [Candidatus Margulisbacteria bacterium]|nr:cation:proton antiporter [Candidatus Margulisiibacteriota bacterium]